ncbi:hypothetical protein ADUPG1_005573, partial [Aduncisulcus paluster]
VKEGDMLKISEVFLGQAKGVCGDSIWWKEEHKEHVTTSETLDQWERRKEENPESADLSYLDLIGGRGLFSILDSDSSKRISGKKSFMSEQDRRSTFSGDRQEESIIPYRQSLSSSIWNS